MAFSDLHLFNFLLYLYNILSFSVVGKQQFDSILKGVSQISPPVFQREFNGLCIGYAI